MQARAPTVGGAMAIAVCAAFSLACWQAPMVERFARVDAMVGHEEGLANARERLSLGNVDGAREVGKTMAAAEPIPGVDDQTLAEMRFAAARLADAETLEDGAAALAEMTRTCANCHRGWEVTPPVPLTPIPEEIQWLALAFESNELWEQGKGDPALDSWAKRRDQAAKELIAQGETGGK